MKLTREQLDTICKEALKSATSAFSGALTETENRSATLGLGESDRTILVGQVANALIMSALKNQSGDTVAGLLLTERFDS